MKLNLTQIEIASGLVFLLAWVVGTQNMAMANQELVLTPAQAQHFSRDLVPSNSQDFFQQGRERLERETQRLTQRQDELKKPPLTINFNPQGEVERLPQLQSPQSK
jgi:hypothetical protein